MNITRLLQDKRMVTLLLAVAAGATSAQQLGDIAGKANLSDAERAKRDADKVYQWIRFNADAAAKPKPPSAKPAAAPAPAAATAAAPAIKPRPVATPAPAEAITAATALPAASAPPAASITPALVAAAAAPAPELLASLAPAAAMSPPPAARPPLPEPAPINEGLQLLERVEPEFPRNVLRDGGSGSVLVRLQVEANGSVSGAEVLRSSNRRLVPPVLQAVARWRFAPQARAQSAEVEIGFRSE